MDDWRRQDKHPGIPSGLLNIDQIEQYAASSSLISPFQRSSSGVKPASYGLPLHGHCVWWNEYGERKDAFLSSNHADPEAAGIPIQSSIEIPRNSIIFITLGPKIRLPYFIAARFNLRIKWIYAGLLVGTGPLVDPGFNDSLTCPIHNLTNDSYILRADDGVFAWIEFTKLSLPDVPESMSSSSVHRYAERGLDVLLHQANNGKPVRSSIPAEISKMAVRARRSEKSAKKAENYARGFTLAASISVLIALCALFATFYNGVQALSAQNHSLSVTGSRSYVDDRMRLETEITKLQVQLKNDEATLNILSKRGRTAY